MDDPVSHLEELSRRVAEESDKSADPSVLEDARRRALAGFRARGGPKNARTPSWSRRLAFAAAAAIVAIALFFVKIRSGSALTYTVGDEGSPHAIGAWIAASEREVPLRFSEGTQITLAAQARARVTRADEDGAEVLLERGSVQAKVVHRSASTRWAVRAGPFEVHVVGTELAIAWDPTRDEIDVHIREGRVIVSGPLLDGGRALSTGQRLHVAVREQRLDLTVEASNALPSEAREAEGARATAAEGAREAACPPDRCPQGITNALPSNSKNSPPSAPHATASEAQAPPVGKTWRELAAGGKHRDAMEAVDREGFANVLSRSSGPELLALADVARYAGDYGRARSALLRARDKGQRGRPAFLLGKIAADNLGAAGDAITWFQTYLAEEPGGGLAEQALGRIIELKRRSGDSAGARAAAQKYLSRYPSGAYTSLAKLAAEP